MISVKKNALILNKNDLIDSALKRLDEINTGSASLYPLICVVDESFRLIGVISDGDFRRFFSSGGLKSMPIEQCMNRAPRYLRQKEITPTNLRSIYSSLSDKLAKKEFHRFLPVVDDDRKVIDVLDLLEYFASRAFKGNAVTVYGLGFVGLTLATFLAIRGLEVEGIDRDKSLISDLNSGEIRIHEIGLSSAMLACNTKGNLCFSNNPSGNTKVKIVAVGTPVSEDGVPNLFSLTTCIETIAKQPLMGSLVILRSTVPVGTTRSLTIDVLERLSGLVAGQDFYVAFCPERTIEGRAMEELALLPQIVGGYSKDCENRALEFWQSIGVSTVKVQSLEAAEMVKLANNSFRDLSFAFSNELVLLASKYNINAFELIRCCNENYPRNKIPSPSPGVGGYCLTKDPFIYSSSIQDAVNGEYISLSRHGRFIHELVEEKIYKIVEDFRNISTDSRKVLTVFVVGIAFKGIPATNDLRGSVAISLIKNFKKNNFNVIAWDAVVKPSEAEREGINQINDLSIGAKISDVVLVMNNHDNNLILADNLEDSDERKLFFDGWGLFHKSIIEAKKGWNYATLGYGPLYPNNEIN